jgi:PAS domain S-box-containing protein
VATSQTDPANQAGERRYRHLFENMPICIFVADLNVTPATILQVNRRAELVYGYAAAELVGMPAAQLVPEDARPAVLSVVQGIQQGETVTIETSAGIGTERAFPYASSPHPTPLMTAA